MDILERLNEAVEYIETNLCEEIEVSNVASVACVSADSFIRFFSYMTGMTLNEYIRRRRLTLAARDLRYSKSSVVEIAVKYGYDSAVAFSRAFAKQHGMTPTFFRKTGGSLKVYPPVSFHIVIKGAEKMDFRIIELKETVIYGISKQFEGEGYNTREELRHSMWASDCDDVPSQLCTGSWNQPKNTALDGVWYGVWQNGKYMIAREKADVKMEMFEKFTLPKGTYAAFKTECGALAWEEFPRLFELIFESWLPSSGYKQKSDFTVEIYHLWTDYNLRKKNRYFEVWIPVE